MSRNDDKPPPAARKKFDDANDDINPTVLLTEQIRLLSLALLALWAWCALAFIPFSILALSGLTAAALCLNANAALELLRSEAARVSAEMYHRGLAHYLPAALRAALLEGPTVDEWMADSSFTDEWRFLALYFVPGLDDAGRARAIAALPERHRRFLLEPRGYARWMLPETALARLLPAPPGAAGTEGAAGPRPHAGSVASTAASTVTGTSRGCAPPPVAPPRGRAPTTRETAGAVLASAANIFGGRTALAATADALSLPFPPTGGDVVARTEMIRRVDTFESEPIPVIDLVWPSEHHFGVASDLGSVSDVESGPVSYASQDGVRAVAGELISVATPAPEDGEEAEGDGEDEGDGALQRQEAELVSRIVEDAVATSASSAAAAVAASVRTAVSDALGRAAEALTVPA
eukprot:CAMPEP_0194316112 /NCGR_PEP_ID=MMETSP0171-20130528/12919_1 /TAXON_ID=218684 /ORGANISM="Corethron pennatum, Strain L29A3" /LENGTH=406 /DNA_ID=CAMNT_0039072229 /DNA_START=25 /DNA_END=1241 /DNA_ORIENTATION=-